MSITLPALPTHRRCASSSPDLIDFARLRLSSPEIIRPQYNARLERPKPMIHRRAYSLNHSSPILRLPLPKRTSNFNTTPLNLPSISELDLPARTPSRTPSPIPSRAITPPLQKRTIQVDPSLAAHLKKGGVVFLKSKDGRRLRVCLPPRMMGV